MYIQSEVIVDNREEKRDAASGENWICELEVGNLIFGTLLRQASFGFQEIGKVESNTPSPRLW